jgi:transcriptional regulator with XRE-family HTH domain
MRTLSFNPLPCKGLADTHHVMAWHNKLKAALSASGLNGSAVARRLVEDGLFPDLTPQAVNAWLRGKAEPSYRVLSAMCRYAAVSADWVLDDTRSARLVPESQGEPFTVSETEATPATPPPARPRQARRRRAE